MYLKYGASCVIHDSTLVCNATAELIGNFILSWYLKLFLLKLNQCASNNSLDKIKNWLYLTFNLEIGLDSGLQNNLLDIARAVHLLY